MFIFFFLSTACEKDNPEFYIIHFYEFTVTIIAEDSSLLYENCSELINCERLSVELAGHTNSIGGDEWNLHLSQERADTVKAWLVRHGVQPSQLAAVGFGERYPVADNRTAKGRAQNDRVEFVTICE